VPKFPVSCGLYCLHIEEFLITAPGLLGQETAVSNTLPSSKRPARIVVLRRPVSSRGARPEQIACKRHIEAFWPSLVRTVEPLSGWTPRTSACVHCSHLPPQRSHCGGGARASETS
jgi:hypothetical protein